MSGLHQTAAEAKEAREAIARRMGNVREHLATDASSVADRIRTATDWKHQVAEHPVIAAGVAAAVGFWLVPSRPRVETIDAKSLERLAREHKLVVANSAAEEKNAGLMAAGLALAANFALRAATAYVGQQAGRVFSQPKSPSRATAEEGLQ